MDPVSGQRPAQRTSHSFEWATMQKSSGLALPPVFPQRLAGSNRPNPGIKGVNWSLREICDEVRLDTGQEAGEVVTSKEIRIPGSRAVASLAAGRNAGPAGHASP